MDIRIYIGAHRTATKHLINTLLENNKQLEDEGIVFFNAPKVAMRRIIQASKEIKDGADKADVTGEMLHAFTNGIDAKKLLIVNPGLIGNLSRAFGKELFYPHANKSMKQIHEVFEHHELRLYASVRNPATFLPSCYSESMQSASLSPYADYIKDVNILNMKWSSLIHRLQRDQNSTPLTIWRFEDYPYIWRDVAQAFAGLSNGQNLLGKTERINPGLVLNGAHLFRKYIAKYGIENGENFDAVKSIYQERFPSSPNMITGPDWPAETVGMLTNNYDDDWYYIERIEGVQTIQARHNLIHQ